jgi:RNA polymerase sigma factor (sigma-70 family)
MSVPDGAALSGEPPIRGTAPVSHQATRPTQPTSRLTLIWTRRGLAATRRPAGPPERAGRDRYAEVDERDRLWRAVVLLPRRQRAVVVLRFYEDLSERETAETLGIAVGTVKSTCARALAKLRVSPQLADTVEETR